MLEAIERIQAYSEGMRFEVFQAEFFRPSFSGRVFQADIKTVDAVERCLQRLTEAAIRLARMARV